MPDPIILDAPGLAKLAAQVATILRSDAAMRAMQSANAPQAKYFDQQAAWPVASGIYSIQQAQSDSEKFSTLQITFDATSGSGRYRIDGPLPTAAGGGVGIPALGVVLTIEGADNVKNFKLIAETGQVLVFARYVFL